MTRLDPFTGQAWSSKQLTSIVHILSQLTTALLESVEGREVIMKGGAGGLTKEGKTNVSLNTAVKDKV